MKKIVGFKVLIISILLTVPFIAWGCTRSIKSSEFDNNCTYHLDRFQTEENMNDAIKELDLAITYAEKRNLNNGYTSIMDRSSSEDLGVWFKALKDSSEYLHKIDDSKKLEDYAMINKKRQSASIVKPTVSSSYIPAGISVFPHNVLYFVWGLLSFFLMIMGIVGIVIFINSRASE